MYFLHDPLTQYFVEGAFEHGYFSPITVVIASNFPPSFHEHISLHDIAGTNEEADYKDIEDTFLKVARSLPSDELSYFKKHLLSAVGDYTYHKAKGLASFISNKCTEELPKETFPKGTLVLVDILTFHREEQKYKSVSAIKNPIDALHPTNVARYVHEFISHNQLMFSAVVEFCKTPYDPIAAQRVEDKFALQNTPRIREVLFTDTQVNKGEFKRKCQRVKKAISRASKLFSMLPSGDKNLSVFLSGGKADVCGAIFDYKLSKSYSMLSCDPKMHHIPYKLELLEKGSGLVLAELCVVFSGQPMLDQVFSFLTYIHSGKEMEQELLKVANAFNVDDRAYDNDLFVEFFGNRIRRVSRTVQSDESDRLNDESSVDDFGFAKSRYRGLKQIVQSVNTSLIADLLFSAFCMVDDKKRFHIHGEIYKELPRQIDVNDPNIQLAGGQDFINAIKQNNKARETIIGLSNNESILYRNLEYIR